jgi:ArsR family transcriptional regulator, arsenate/arsenite/antimonite-responsive transcriptional repressor / arsenate reductase (thioredoxin)
MPDMMSQPPEFIMLLAHDLRWNLVKALTTSDHRVQELVALVDEPMNLVSYHLKKLRDVGVVSTRRSEADGRDIYYSLDLVRLRDLYQAAGAALHPALSAAHQNSSDNPSLNPSPLRGEGLESRFAPPPHCMERGLGGGVNSYETGIPQRILFVCTRNSARSQMAEALMRDLAGKSVEVYSAGSHPTRLHPEAIRTMDELGIDIRRQRSKGLQEFAGQSFDHIITVCDRAREICPTFPGEHLHWGFADPVAIENAAERRHAFEKIAAQLVSRIQYFLAAINQPTIN